MNIRKLALTGLFTALICLATMAIVIPVGNGYIHAGDGFIFLSSVILSNPYAMFAAGVGSALADILTGYVTYAPYTLVIKCLMGLVIGKLAMIDEPFSAKTFISLILASAIMIFGYALTDVINAMLLGGTEFSAGVLLGVASIPPNIIQSLSGFGIYFLVMKLLHPVIKKRIKPID